MIQLIRKPKEKPKIRKCFKSAGYSVKRKLRLSTLTGVAGFLRRIRGTELVRLWRKGRDVVGWRSTGLRSALRHIWNKHGRIYNPRSISPHEMSSRTLWEKDWRGRDRVETPELILSELNCDFVQKFITALSHSSQCTESQVYWSGANWHSRCWPLNCDSWCTVSVELKIKRQEATTKQIIEGWHNHKHNCLSQYQRNWPTWPEDQQRKK